MSEYLCARADVERALLDPRLRPPAAPASVGTGSTSELRASMARFSHGDEHTERRSAVDRLVAMVDPGACQAAASTHAARWFDGREVDGHALASQVPGAAFAEVLGLAGPGSLAAVSADVGLVAAAIGAGRPVDEAIDDATDRLLAAAADAGHDPVAAVSLLYQNHAATRALLLTNWHAEALGTDRLTAVVRTIRVDDDDEYVLDLRAADLEFGAGPHACPGRSIAESLVHGVMTAATSAGYTVDPATTICDNDGIPTELFLVPSTGAVGGSATAGVL